MKRISVISAMLTLCGGIAFSQGQLDAFKYGQTDLSGTARYMSMGGAFGALGGDVSVMSANPAGLAVYRSSEVGATLGLSSANTQTDWLGTMESNNKKRTNFDNIAYVGYFPTANDVGVVSWNAGFSYNRLKNFHRDYTMSSGRDIHTSLTDYIAARATGNDYDIDGANDPYMLPDWLSVLGYNAGLIEAFNDNSHSYYSSFGAADRNGEWVPSQIDNAGLRISERGAIDQYNIAFGINLSDRVFLGADLAVTDIDYSFSSQYDEKFQNDDDFFIDNRLSTEGSGYSVNVGAIVHPADFLRLGVAYNSPTWYKMTDYFYGAAASSVTMDNNKNNDLTDNTPEGQFYEYRYRSPDKWLLSAAIILGRSALISVDYELANYKGMRMYDRYGDAEQSTNNDINANFNRSTTVRAGAEVKLTPQFALRAGGSWSGSSMTEALRNGKVEVATAGTIPHFTLDRGVTNYTFGFGYRFTPSFYTDLACVLTTSKEDVHVFSNLFDKEGALFETQPASLKTNRIHTALTVGYKF